MEFLGRRDSQLKIRGFRIELGEIENTLLRVPGVRDGAVVVAERADQSKHLVAFYSSPQPLDIDAVRDRLAESLPEYMVPSAFHWREHLPLTANSKIDKKTLTRLAGSSNVVEDDYDAPRTRPSSGWRPAWSKVLGVPRDRSAGGTTSSTAAAPHCPRCKLAVMLDRRSPSRTSPRHPVLADLAGSSTAGRAAPGLLQSLRSRTANQAGALVCFPYAGGNAVNFRPLAPALRGSGLAVYAVELPGHDVAATGESFAPMEHVVAQVVAEITARV